ncbi:MFS transporter [Desulfofundulus sp. TPOSR]|uniref:Major facilitator superfamily MFS_1 n=1 Tax=Desulfofundulus kuznetsovii (strain DSM 6115 / VKM B-1805 / 17) TaxID=760568 RepID=A0AAU8PBM1_DESK7|nr:MFS transporter [Desulfofundulus sp. TPOSR]AEG14720.1 major facilitator superfamily MFS_1 [Desulfofundulus kuznetsovii DSM 6115]NHM25843.1 MFS transporter [Desulfofundulus sp. TPOSR]
MLPANLTRQEWILLVILFTTEFARGAFFLSFLPIYAVKHLGLSITAAGFAVSAHYFTETASKTAAGWHFDRTGRPVLLIGLITGLASLMAMKLWPLPVILVGASALLGLGMSPVWLGVMSEVAPVEMPGRASRVGLVFAAWLAGAGAGLVAVNFILHRGFEPAFSMIIILWLVSVVLTLFILPSRGRREKQTRQGIFLSLARLATNPAVTRILIPGMFLQTFCAGLLLPVLPLFAQNQLGLSYNQYGLLLLAGGGTAVLGLLPMGMVLGRLTLNSLLAAGFGLSALCLGLLAVSHGPQSAFPLAILLGLSYAVILPAWNTLLARVIPPERQATGWGVFATVEGLGAAIGPALGSLVARYGGITAPIMLATLLLITVAIFYTFYPLEKFLVK